MLDYIKVGKFARNFSSTLHALRQACQSRAVGYSSEADQNEIQWRELGSEKKPEAS